MAKQASISRPWVIGIIVAVALAAVYFGVNSFLGARLVGPDVAQKFVPLVRHVLLSQTHCYDDGSTYCEDVRLAGAQSTPLPGDRKEFTVAYLFGQRPRLLGNRDVNMVYGCFKKNKNDYLITTNQNDCRRLDVRAYFFGYTAKTNDNFETSTELFRCYNQSAHNYLVTDDRRECELSAHTDEIVSLGWAAAGGHLPQRRLEGMCLAAKQANVLKDAYDGYCRNLSNAGATTRTPDVAPEAGSTPTPTPAPTPTPPPATTSWQNPRNRHDVNNDGIITNNDLMIIINSLNAKGPRNLIQANEPLPPPFIDVNGDKSLTNLDYQILGACLNDKKACG